MAESRDSGGGGGCGCFTLVLLMIIAGLVAWSMYGYDPQAAVGIGIFGGIAAYFTIPCAIAALVLLVAGIGTAAVLGIVLLFAWLNG